MAAHRGSDTLTELPEDPLPVAPWQGLDRSWVRAFNPHLGHLPEEMITAIRHHVPAFAQPLDDPQSRFELILALRAHALSKTDKTGEAEPG